MTIKAQTPDGYEPNVVADYPADRRIPRDVLYMRMAGLFALRSTCNRGHVGCVAVIDNRVVCAGYNGAPKGMAHCLDVGCGGGVVVNEGKLDPLMGGEMPRPAERQDQLEFPNGCTRTIHAEANMVAYAARMGLSLDGATVFTTGAPCLPCAQLLIAVGTLRLVYKTPYRIPDGLRLMDQANIQIERLDV